LLPSSLPHLLTSTGLSTIHRRRRSAQLWKKRLSPASRNQPAPVHPPSRLGRKLRAICSNRGYAAAATIHKHKPGGRRAKKLHSHVTAGLRAVRLFYQLNLGCRSSKMTRSPPLASSTNCWGLTPTRIPRRELDCPLPAPNCQNPLSYCLARRRLDCSPPHVCRDDDDDDVVQ
jgi:hypothetical protein